MTDLHTRLLHRDGIQGSQISEEEVPLFKMLAMLGLVEWYRMAGYWAPRTSRFEPCENIYYRLKRDD